MLRDSLFQVGKYEIEKIKVKQLNPRATDAELKFKLPLVIAM